jgi:hypothetical protein
MKCEKCQSDCTVEVTKSLIEGDIWIVKSECVNLACHARTWERVPEAERIPVPVSRGMMFSKNKGLKCEICDGYTDILHPHTIEGDKDYLLCGFCKANFDEAEGLSRFNSNFL